MSLEEFGHQKSGEAWASLDSTWGGMAALLKETPGPYFLGDIVSYADFQLVAILHWAKRANKSIFDRLVAFEPAFGTIYSASQRVYGSQG
jgi:glutathione S-transferase